MKLLSKFNDLKNLAKIHINELPVDIRQKIRDKAISNVEKNMISYGRSLNDITESDYEDFVCNEEEKIWREIKSKSFNAILLIFFGVSL